MLSLKLRRKKEVEFTLEDLTATELNLSGEAPEGFSEVESYWLEVPYARASIQTNGDEYFYCLLEPQASSEEKELLRNLTIKVMERVPLHISEDDRITLFESFKDVVTGMDINTIAKLWYYLERDCFYAGRITPLLKDPFVEDISCSGYNMPVYVYHKNYESIPTNVVMEQEELDDFVLAVAQRSGVEISVANPIADTTLFDGSRANVTFRKEVTDRGSTFSIRKVKKTPITPVDLIRWNSFSVPEMATLWLSINCNGSILFVGGTAAGKTTAMNATSLFIPLHAKVISIEDTREVVLPHKNWIPGVANDRVTMFDLLKAALRQRPEYMIVGEVRGKEAEIMFQAMALGHTCLATVHGSSAEGVLDRLSSPPYSIPESLIQNLDLVVVVGRYRIGNKIVRRCSGIWHVGEGCKVHTVFEWDPAKDHHARKSGIEELFETLSKRTGKSTPELEQDIFARSEVLRGAVETGVNYDEFVKEICRISIKGETGGETE